MNRPSEQAAWSSAELWLYLLTITVAGLAGLTLLFAYL